MAMEQISSGDKEQIQKQIEIVVGDFVRQRNEKLRDSASNSVKLELATEKLKKSRLSFRKERKEHQLMCTQASNLLRENATLSGKCKNLKHSEDTWKETARSRITFTNFQKRDLGNKLLFVSNILFVEVPIFW